MKRIVAINCSPRTAWNTAALVREAARGAEEQGVEVKDYSRYNWTMFNPEAKKARHEAVFPEDKKKAFALGERMASGSWE